MDVPFDINKRIEQEIAEQMKTANEFSLKYSIDSFAKYKEICNGIKAIESLRQRGIIEFYK